MDGKGLTSAIACLLHDRHCIWYRFDPTRFKPCSLAIEVNLTLKPLPKRLRPSVTSAEGAKRVLFGSVEARMRGIRAAFCIAEDPRHVKAGLYLYLARLEKQQAMVGTGVAPKLNEATVATNKEV
jgi:hypothetical protein